MRPRKIDDSSPNKSLIYPFGLERGKGLQISSIKHAMKRMREGVGERGMDRKRGKREEILQELSRGLACQGRTYCGDCSHWPCGVDRALRREGISRFSRWRRQEKGQGSEERHEKRMTEGARERERE